jgi:polyhydroxyalkanoate synthase subunit PhaC
MAWVKPMSGKLGKPPTVSTERYPALADAPGTYVLES